MNWIKWFFSFFKQQTTKGIILNNKPVAPQKNPEKIMVHRDVANYSISELSNMLDLGTDIELCDKSGLSPLHVAIEINFIRGIHLLLEKGASMTVRDKEGNAPSHFAVKIRNVDLVQKLLNKGADSTETDRYGMSSLHMAACNNDWDMFDLLLQARKCDVTQEGLEAEVLKIILSREYEIIEISELNTLINIKNNKCGTPFYIALRKSDLNLTGMLLEFGADTDSRDNLGRTALHIAVENDSYQIVKLLIDRGVSVNIVSKNQEHLLFSAIRKRDLKILTELLIIGANIESRHTNHNITPLLFATRQNFTPEVELLLERGTDINVRGFDEDTPLDWVTKYRNFNLFPKLLDNGAHLDTNIYPANSAIYNIFNFDLGQTVALILKNNLDANMKDYCGKSPLHFISSNGALVELLLDNGADIEAADSYGETPLLTAMRKNPLNEQVDTGVEVLIKRGANINVRDGEGRTLLHYALRNRGFVNILLNNGADIEAKDSNGMTPIFYIINNSYGAESFLEQMLNYGAIVNVQDNKGRTPLHHAVFLDNLALVKVLLFYGADLEVKDSDGETPFFAAVMKDPGDFRDDNSLIISILIQAGTLVNSVDNYGRTVLFYGMNNLLMKKLLHSGADVTIKDNNGQTALHMAMMYNGKKDDNIDNVLDLIENGANLLSQDNEGITPLQIYFNSRFLESDEMFSSVRDLSDIKPSHIHGYNTLLHFSVMKCFFKCVKHMLDVGIYVNGKNKFGDTPIHLAAQFTYKDNGVNIVKELIQNGASPNAQNSNKETPLHKAAISDNQDLIKELLIRGARMDIENNSGKTPLQVYSSHEPQNNKMIEHIVILRTANLLDDLTCNVDSLDFSGFDSFKVSCLEELRRLEEYKCNSLSLIDVFRKMEDPLFVSCSEFKNYITSPTLEQKFPIYGPYLKVKFEKAELRQFLLNSAMSVIGYLISRSNIPNEIKRKILSKLSNDDLLQLLDQ